LLDGDIAIQGNLPLQLGAAKKEAPIQWTGVSTYLVAGAGFNRKYMGQGRLTITLPFSA
jgi:hypothetical protein